MFIYYKLSNYQMYYYYLVVELYYKRSKRLDMKEFLFHECSSCRILIIKISLIIDIEIRRIQ